MIDSGGIGSLRFSLISEAIRMVSSEKYTAATTNSSTMRATRAVFPAAGIAPVRIANNCAVTHIAIAAIAGLPSRLVQRFDVRKEMQAASTAAATTAASGPTPTNSMNTNTSAADTDVF